LVLKVYAKVFYITGCKTVINKKSFLAGVAANFCNWFKNIGLNLIIAAAKAFLTRI